MVPCSILSRSGGKLLCIELPLVQYLLEILALMSFKSDPDHVPEFVPRLCTWSDVYVERAFSTSCFFWVEEAEFCPQSFARAPANSETVEFKILFGVRCVPRF